MEDGYEQYVWGVFTVLVFAAGYVLGALLHQCP